MDKPEMTLEKDNTCKCTTKELDKDALTGMLHQLSEQSKSLFNENKQLRQMVDEMNMTNLFKRLDYLFAIINNTSGYLSEEFKKECAKDIETIMFQPEEVESPQK